MTIALFILVILAISAGVLLVYGINNAPTVDKHPATVGVCTPSRARMLTGANLRQEQLIAIQQDSEELQRQAAEIERLRAVIRQRNRTIKRMQAQLGQAVTQPVTVGGDRFEWLELRGQS